MNNVEAYLRPPVHFRLFRWEEILANRGEFSLNVGDDTGDWNG